MGWRVINTDMSKKHSFFIWGGWYASTNIGDRTLLISIMDLILDEYPDAKFTVASPSPSIIKSYLPEHLRVITTLLESKKDILKVISSFKDLKVFVFGGGVPFYDEVAHNLVMMFYVVLAKLFGAKIITWAVASQTIHTEFTKFALRLVVKNSDVITCRDGYTNSLLISCGAEPIKVKIVPDPGYTIQDYNFGGASALLSKAGYNGSEKLVGLSPRTLRRGDGESHTHFAAQKAEAQQKEIDVYARFVDILIERGFKPVFIPMNTTAPDDDRIVTGMIIEKAKFGSKVIEIMERVEFGQIVEVFQNCEFSMVSRIHGSINSFNANIPWIMYAFDSKHQELMKVLGLESWMFNPETMNIEQIDSLADEMIKHYREQKKWITTERVKLVQSAATPIRMLAYIS